MWVSENPGSTHAHTSNHEEVVLQKEELESRLLQCQAELEYKNDQIQDELACYGPLSRKLCYLARFSLKRK